MGVIAALPYSRFLNRSLPGSDRVLVAWEKIMDWNRRAIILMLVALVLTDATASRALAASAAKINKAVDASLKKLYAANPTAKLIGENAKGVLVFPSIWKAASSSAGRAATAPSARMASRSATTTRPRRPTACKPVPKHSGTRSSS